MINIIVATSKNNQIGINNKLPWHISEDLKYFKCTTSGKTILMGRKTFESIGKPLPNRKNIVLTRDMNFKPDGVTVIHSLEEALEICKNEENIFIIGGGEIYSLFLPYADYLYITLVDKVIYGDTDFPSYDTDFELIQSTPGKTLTTDGYSFAFTLWKRKEK